MLAGDLTGILHWPDPIYFILIQILTGPLYELFSVDARGPIETADTPSGSGSQFQQALQVNVLLFYNDFYVYMRSIGNWNHYGNDCIIIGYYGN